MSAPDEPRALTDEATDPSARRRGDRTITSPSTLASAELEDEIDSVLALIVQFPEAAPEWKHRVDRRMAVLDRFPFTMPYQIVGDEIVVLALAHTSRRPGYWSRR